MTTRTITLELTDLDIELLRLWLDKAPLNPFAPMLNKVLRQLPLDTDIPAYLRYLESAADKLVSADSAPPARRVPGTGGGFPRANVSQALRNVFETRLPHGGSL